MAQAALAFALFQQVGEDLRPSAVAPPPAKAGIEALPGAIAFRDVPPRSPGVQPPEDAVDDAPVILQRPATAAVMSRGWQEWRKMFPLLLGKFIAVSPGWPP
jgi:hypothetical protein